MTLFPTVDPIVVIVKDGRYDCFSLTLIPTARDLYLIGILQDMGGVSDGVVEGTYHFNTEMLDADNTVVHLDLQTQ